MKNMQRCCLCLLLITILHATLMMGQRASAGKGALRVITYNVDEGTEFIDLQNATTSSQFLVVVGETISAVRLTEPLAHMQASCNRSWRRLGTSPAMCWLTRSSKCFVCPTYTNFLTF